MFLVGLAIIISLTVVQNMALYKRINTFTCQFPINPIDYHQRSFQRELLADILERDIGVIAMKTSADGRLLREGICTIEEALRYVWSLPVSIAVVGMERPAIVRGELVALRRRIEPRADLSLEWYKT